MKYKRPAILVGLFLFNPNFFLHFPLIARYDFMFSITLIIQEAKFKIMRISKLLMSAFAAGILMTAFISCEKNEYVQPDRDVSTQATESDRGNDSFEEEEYNYGGCEGG